jgi:hypothetical protein
MSGGVCHSIWPVNRWTSRLRTAPAGLVVRVYPIIATRRLGIKIADALMSDGETVRFRVLSRDPLAVRAIGDGRLLGHEQAIELWLTEQRQPEQRQPTAA